MNHRTRIQTHTHNEFRKTALAHAINGAIAALLFGSAGLAHSQAQTSPASKAEPVRLEDIVVTAQKVAQPISKTALSITAIGGDDLRAAGATTAVNLTTLIPNIQIAPGTNSSTDISIRGIGSTNTTEVGDPAAAFHVDGVYLGRPQSAGATFYDLERIEVLRGPQGTLYGRNATAGAINLITNKPGKKLAAEANLGFGDYNSRAFEGMLNVPVSEQLALRAVISSSKREGYLNTTSAANGFSKNRDDADNLSARLHGLVTFSADTRLLLTADISRNKGAGPGTVSLATYLTASGAAQRTALGNKTEGLRDDESTGLAAELTSNLGFAELTYLGAHRTYDRDSNSSTGPITSGTRSQFKQTSHELRLASNGKSSLAWVAGLYAFDEKGNMDALFGINPFGAANPGYRFIQDPVTSKSTAVFGQLTYSISPELRLTAGLRNTNDSKARNGRLTSASGTFVFAPGDNKAKVSYSQTTYKLGVDYDLAKDVLAYANVATGYKAGGYFDGSNARGDNTYRPELLTSVELGMKGKFLDNRLRLSAAVFSYDYKDLQISYVAINPLTNSVGTITTNAARARNTGLELEGKWAVTDGGTVNFALGVLDAKYKSFVFPVALPTRPAAINYSGKALDKAPSTTISLGYTHDWSLASGAGITASINTRYSSSYVLSNFAVANPVQYTQAAFNRTDINATYNAPGDSWYVQGYVRNIENRNVMTGFSFSSLTGSQVYLSEPRNFGVRVGMKFF